MEPFTSTTVQVPYQTNEDGSPSTIEQMLWPDHCVRSLQIVVFIFNLLINHVNRFSTPEARLLNRALDQTWTNGLTKAEESSSIK